MNKELKELKRNKSVYTEDELTEFIDAICVAETIMETADKKELDNLYYIGEFLLESAESRSNPYYTEEDREYLRNTYGKKEKKMTTIKTCTIIQFNAKSTLLRWENGKDLYFNKRFINKNDEVDYTANRMNVTKTSAPSWEEQMVTEIIDMFHAGTGEKAERPTTQEGWKAAAKVAAGKADEQDIYQTTRKFDSTKLATKKKKAARQTSKKDLEQYELAEILMNDYNSDKRSWRPIVNAALTEAGLDTQETGESIEEALERLCDDMEDESLELLEEAIAENKKEERRAERKRKRQEKREAKTETKTTKKASKKASLMTCEVCDGKMSSAAPACPHCGNPNE